MIETMRSMSAYLHGGSHDATVLGTKHVTYDVLLVVPELHNRKILLIRFCDIPDAERNIRNDLAQFVQFTITAL